MPNITKTFLDKLATPATGYKLYWDGFGVRISAGGKQEKLDKMAEGMAPAIDALLRKEQR